MSVEIPEADLEALIGPVEDLVAAAGEAIMAVYASADPAAREKADASPVTRADMEAHAILSSGLAALTPEIPVLSEEGEHQGAGERAAWARCWIVDPLDGTREFLDRNPEFTVNVALVEGQRPRFGCVGVPAQGALATGLVASRRSEYVTLADGARTVLTTARLDPDARFRVLASRMHRNDALEALMGGLCERFPRLEEGRVGSAVKLVELAAGRADLYPRRGPCSEWDIAAGEAVLCAAGGAIFDRSGAPLRYNKADSLLMPDFNAVGDAEAPWAELLGDWF